MNFTELTHCDGETILVNLNLVNTITTDDNLFSTLWFTEDDSITVKESIDELASIIFTRQRRYKE